MEQNIAEYYAAFSIETSIGANNKNQAEKRAEKLANRLGFSYNEDDNPMWMSDNIKIGGEMPEYYVAFKLETNIEADNNNQAEKRAKELANRLDFDYNDEDNPIWLSDEIEIEVEVEELDED